MRINIVIPIAGSGSRFTEAGYTKPKPFIDVLGKPMIVRVIENLSCNNDPESNITAIHQPNVETRIKPESSIPLPVKQTSKPNGESKDFFKRVAGLFGKTKEREDSIPPGTKS